MYESWWGMSASPFTNRLETRWFHESPVHEEALARLFYLIEEQRGLGLVMGESGTGKSLLLKVLGSQVRRTRRHFASVDLLGLDGHEMLWQVAAALQLAPDESATRWSLWRAVADHVEALRLSRSQLVFAFDHLERADASCHQLLERLLNLGRSGKGVTFVAAIRSAEFSKLARLLGEQADLRVELTPLQLDETDEFIHDLIQKAGCDRNVFSGDAVIRIHAVSQGNPRLICRICELAMVAAMAGEHGSITDDLVDSVTEGLVIPAESDELQTRQHQFA